MRDGIARGVGAGVLGVGLEGRRCSTKGALRAGLEARPDDRPSYPDRSDAHRHLLMPYRPPEPRSCLARGASRHAPRRSRSRCWLVGGRAWRSTVDTDPGGAGTSRRRCARERGATCPRGASDRAGWRSSRNGVPGTRATHGDSGSPVAHGSSRGATSYPPGGSSSRAQEATRGGHERHAWIGAAGVWKGAADFVPARGALLRHV